VIDIDAAADGAIVGTTRSAISACRVESVDLAVAR